MTPGSLSRFMRIVFLRHVLLAALALAPLFGVGAPAAQLHAQAAVATSPEAESPAKDQQEQDETEAYRHSPMVTKMGALLGMNRDQSATAFEIFNFALLAGLVLWGMARALPKMFRERNTAIQKHLVDARVATEEARLRLEAVEARLAKLDEEIAGMRSAAEAGGEQEEQRLRAAIEDEKNKILAAAEQDIAAAAGQAQKELQHFAAELAIAQAAQRLVITAETDRLLIQNFARRLSGEESKGQN